MSTHTIPRPSKPSTEKPQLATFQVDDFAERYAGEPVFYSDVTEEQMIEAEVPLFCNCNHWRGLIADASHARRLFDVVGRSDLSVSFGEEFHPCTLQEEALLGYEDAKLDDDGYAAEVAVVLDERDYFAEVCPLG